MVGLTCRSAEDAQQRVPTNENHERGWKKFQPRFLLNLDVKNA
jgi:hypothetical protein